MKTTYRKSFTRDLKKIKDVDLRDRIRQAIEEVEAANDLAALSSVQKMAGSTDCFRIRVGDYRIGIVLEGDSVEFVRCLSRKDLYRYFP